MKRFLLWAVGVLFLAISCEQDDSLSSLETETVPEIGESIEIVFLTGKLEEEGLLEEYLRAVDAETVWDETFLIQGVGKSKSQNTCAQIDLLGHQQGSFTVDSTEDDRVEFLFVTNPSWAIAATFLLLEPTSNFEFPTGVVQDYSFPLSYRWPEQVSGAGHSFPISQFRSKAGNPEHCISIAGYVILYKTDENGSVVEAKRARIDGELKNTQGNIHVVQLCLESACQ
ncbi:hypothetical protein [Croceiramulus getboli]|nr:hypothetical protein P8624_05250 [Flavobacteriaceae bacterium YJPT1-3]